tara:strand:+ start:42 stop:338 length:297 start_codon:yes stop_codon:yes gene_type:complete
MYSEILMDFILPTSLNQESQEKFDQSDKEESESIVSFQAKVPASIQFSMNKFIESYPNWDQYRLIKAALAGFLIQNGVQSRSITRLYVGNMFSLNSFK